MTFKDGYEIIRQWEQKYGVGIINEQIKKCYPDYDAIEELDINEFEEFILYFKKAENSLNLTDISSFTK